MPKFSANLGFLWSHLPRPERVHRAAQAGFQAVELHFPYDTHPSLIKEALDKSGLPLLGINTQRGNIDAGEFGRSALPKREAEGRADIDQALEYAAEVGAHNVHVLAGYSDGSEAKQTFLSNLAYASEKGETLGVGILIEPLNHINNPGYFLNRTAQAAEIIKTLNKPNIKLMFDCYHVQILEGDLTRRLEALMPLIGHIQFASVPKRGEPDQGEINYPYIFDLIDSLGYSGYVGAEYRPRTEGDVEAGLSWLRSFLRV